MLKYLFALVLILLIVPVARTQTINPYNRLIDPFALARLDEPDFAPERMISGWINPQFGTYPLDTSYWIYAEDTGSGIITHLFATSRNPDSETSMRLYVDNALVRQDNMQAFFDTANGYFQLPLDTIIGEARLCDVQIPYHHGFQLMSKLRLYVWYDYCWRPLPSTVSLPAGSQILSSQLISEEAAADSVYRNPSLLWQGTSATDRSYSGIVPAQTDTTLLTIEGSNVIRTFHIRPQSYDTTLDSVWLNFYWDGEATPSFSTSLLSLFGQSYDFRDLHSLAIDFTQDSGFTMRLPMPFAHSMRVELRNRSMKADTVSGTVSAIAMPVDRSVFGYLHAHSSASNPTPFGVEHPVLHVKGSGKYIGTIMGMHDLQIVGTMEGDVIFRVDSSPQHTIDYEGTDDYFNGAMYFSYGNFMTPFGGTSNSYANYFRFHYLDAIDFRSALDVDMQHGIANNSHEYYRTLALWYQHQIPFWCDRDTIHVGELWHLGGANYAANAKIGIWLDSFFVATVQVSSNGSFDVTLKVPSVPVGFHVLNINGEPSPYTVLVTNSPTLEITDLPTPLNFKVGDTVHFTGEGYLPGDSLTLFIAGIPLSCAYSISTSNEMGGWAVIPDVSDTIYSLKLLGMKSGMAQALDLIHITRELRFECENLWTPESSAPGTSEFLPLLDYLPNDFSQTAALSFCPDSACHTVRELIYLPFSDTFSVGCRYGRGQLFGNYDILLDSMVVGHISGYDTVLYRSDSSFLGTRQYRVGPHVLEFRYTGRDHRTTDSVLWADFIQFNPTDAFFDSEVSGNIPNSSKSITVFPNPVGAATTIQFTTSNRSYTAVTIVNQLGVEIARVFTGELAPGEHSFQWNVPAGLARGMYECVVKMDGKTSVIPLVVTQ